MRINSTEKFGKKREKGNKAVRVDNVNVTRKKAQKNMKVYRYKKKIKRPAGLDNWIRNVN
jgi:hypothetical protein